MDVREDVVELYHRTLRVVNVFLGQLQHLSITELKEANDPTIDEMAEQLAFFGHLLNTLADHGNYSEYRMSINIAQAAVKMRELVLAVKNNCQDSLERALGELEELSESI